MFSCGIRGKKNTFHFVLAEGLWWYSINPGSGSSQLSGELCNHFFFFFFFIAKICCMCVYCVLCVCVCVCVCVCMCFSEQEEECGKLVKGIQVGAEPQWAGCGWRRPS